MRTILIILLTTLFVEHSKGQLTVTPVGLYETPDIGNWSKILLVYADSTYQFITKTDRGVYPIEPEYEDRPHWTFNTSDNRLTLKPIKDFKPKIDFLNIQSTADLVDSRQKRWTKFADIDENGHLKQFKEEDGRVVTYNQNGHPLHVLTYLDNKLIEKETFFELDSTTQNEANTFFAAIRRDTNNPYLFYIMYHRQMADYYGIIEKTETLVDGNWTTVYFDKNGKQIKSR